MAKKEMNLTEELKRYFGFDKFKGDQEAIIRNVLAGNDTFVLMPTGGGIAVLSVALSSHGGNGNRGFASYSSDEKPG